MWKQIEGYSVKIEGSKTDAYALAVYNAYYANAASGRGHDTLKACFEYHGFEVRQAGPVDAPLQEPSWWDEYTWYGP